MKTLLFLTVLLLTSCELQYQEQLHPYNLTLYNTSGEITWEVWNLYDIVERNKNFIILKSDEWDTLFFDGKNHLHGILHDWDIMQTHESKFTGELIVNKYKRIEIKGVALKKAGWMQPDVEYHIAIN
jgi:hypothetical protein